MINLIKDNIFSKSVSARSIISKILLATFSSKLGNSIFELYKSSANESDFFRNSEVFYIVLSILSIILALFINNSWLSIWKALLHSDENVYSIKISKIGNRKYTLILMITIICLYLSFVLFLTVGHLIYFGYDSLNYTFSSYLYSTYTSFAFRLILPFLILLIYSITRNSISLFIYLNNILFSILGIYCLLNLDSIFNRFVNSLNLSIVYIFNLILLDFTIVSVISALLEYLIHDNNISEVNCNRLNSRQMSHILFIIYIYGIYVLFLLNFKNN